MHYAVDKTAATTSPAACPYLYVDEGTSPTLNPTWRCTGIPWGALLCIDDTWGAHFSRNMIITTGESVRNWYGTTVRTLFSSFLFAGQLHLCSRTLLDDRFDPVFSCKPDPNPNPDRPSTDPSFTRPPPFFPSWGASSELRSSISAAIFLYRIQVL